MRSIIAAVGDVLGSGAVRGFEEKPGVVLVLQLGQLLDRGHVGLEVARPRLRLQQELGVLGRALRVVAGDALLREGGGPQLLFKELLIVHAFTTGLLVGTSRSSDSSDEGAAEPEPSASPMLRSRLR
jgi:hypothetical protein